MDRTRASRPVPLGLTALVALFSALTALAVSSGHPAHAHEVPAATAATSQSEIAFRNDLRALWEDHIVWTRLAIISLINGSPDTDTTYDVSPQQALLYRLCGDRNPLHADPDFAKAAGFPAPILHGLCSYGIVLRLLTDALLGGDATRVGGFTGRFAGVVFPGETIRVRGWRDDGRILASATIAGKGERDGAPVLADCVLTRT